MIYIKKKLKMSIDFNVKNKIKTFTKIFNHYILSTRVKMK